MPSWSRKTTDATSTTPKRDCSSRQMRLRSRSSPRQPTGVARSVHRFTVVRYFSRISVGSSGRHGTSANGAQPTPVWGSVNSHAYQVNGTTRRSSSSSARRSVRASSAVAPISWNRVARTSEVRPHDLGAGTPRDLGYPNRRLPP